MPFQDKPRDARRQDARLAAPGARKNQRVLLRQGYCGELLRVEVFEVKRQGLEL